MKKSLLTTVLLALILMLVACGSSDNNENDANDTNGEDNTSEEVASNNDLDISATDFEFDQEEYTVESGEEVAIALTNEEGTHGLAIDEFDVNIEGDGEATFTPDEPGEYTIYCSVPCGEGHSDMKSTLVVE